MTAAISDMPPADGWTVDDLDALPEDGVRRELIDGVLHAPPAPSPAHQALVILLGHALMEGCPEALFVSQANDVILSSRRQFIPDLLVVTFESAKTVGKFQASDVVLAIEIVSPSSQSMDRVMKPALYAKAGIPFYWLIETANGLTVTTYRIDQEDGVYQPTGTFTDSDTIRLDEPWPLEIPVTTIRPRNL
ncbi:Uma2 family endonuclease [Actinoplanes sp. NEAU-A12]|uniref:Uma2 family endonuclease n=1 Tax=Actinoplanes sandaracinus TaxID=3045177 RepID=A0ABT6WFU6_9ACTN|nr:Uma2 family endonuclease [Actinoplanes sandaracinus]MDI6098607.1 Uma2 family endonuclease [Actinoplanes sandaracinus]